MSVPLDRLYNHIDSLCDHDVIIYRFFPHGSKKLSDLKMLKSWNWFEYMTQPMAIFHDQEPLNYNLYSQQDVLLTIEPYGVPKVMQDIAKHTHLRGVTSGILGVYDKSIIVHSEKNSSEIQKYEHNDFVGVYWWSHAAIARDWFRYAEHDPNLTFYPKHTHKDFLIYNRAWQGTREYRLKFAELLVQSNLIKDCNTKFSATDSQQHYSQRQFVNPQFQISTVLENYIPTNNHDASASADYDSTDYRTSSMEVVLETLFDDTRWHLTEKSLRPIAIGKPFVLMSTPGSLKYLRSYGFETFAPLIDESYDSIANPVDRMQAVIKEMQRICQLSAGAKTALYQKLNVIAARNKQRFFSSAWQDQIFAELKTNLEEKISYLNNNCISAKFWKQANPEPTQRLVGIKTAVGNEVEQFSQWLRSKGL
jgi:hypothetical protein